MDNLSLAETAVFLPNIHSPRLHWENYGQDWGEESKTFALSTKFKGMPKIDWSW